MTTNEEEVQTVVQIVRSIQERLQDATVNEDGTVTHNIFKAKDGSGPRKFKD